jgi:hypothetical protein
MMSVSVAFDALLQTGWHEKGAIRNDASEEDVKAKKKIEEMLLDDEVERGDEA